ncbi:MAG: hypothetical protein DWQ01_08305 [Planctomycetota bacterium]|nr:MAG: hypothetical protein DWQ01_08305 [Planctomycetota bacterium]
MIPVSTLVIFLGWSNCIQEPQEVDPWQEARQAALSAQQGWLHCQRYLHGWLALADPKSGLIPRNQRHRYWNPQDAGADNYPFMVLSAFYTDPELYRGRMKSMLEAEIALSTRWQGLPDDFDFERQSFRLEKIELSRLIFGASEYVKDGLLPLTECLGPSPWSERLLALVEAIWEQAEVEGISGKLPAGGHEVHGEMLQVLSRLYWMKGDRRYLQWAIRLGDEYLLGDKHPSQDADRLRLRDHGCEILSGLCELYATVHFADSDKKEAYRRPLYQLLDRVLEVGRNEHGLFYNEIDPRLGKIRHQGVADTWGYSLNGYLTVYLLDGVEAYRQAALQVFQSLPKHYRSFSWEGNSSDGYADAIEGALNLLARLPHRQVENWVDQEIRVMWSKQQPSGVVEGWHGDGNFARTTILYNLWKSSGCHLQPWKPDLLCGSARRGKSLHLYLETQKKGWQGKLFFDRPRHRDFFRLPMDWPRINQFPEWYAVYPEQNYLWYEGDQPPVPRKGAELLEGIELSLAPGEIRNIRLVPASDQGSE